MHQDSGVIDGFHGMDLSETVLGHSQIPQQSIYPMDDKTDLWPTGYF